MKAVQTFEVLSSKTVLSVFVSCRLVLMSRSHVRMPMTQHSAVYSESAVSLSSLRSSMQTLKLTNGVLTSFIVLSHFLRCAAIWAF